MKNITLILLLLFIKLSAQNKAGYLSDTNQPWGQQSNITAMNTVYGMDWTQYHYNTVDANLLFIPDRKFIYLEGGDESTSMMVNFINNNTVLMENWVASGGVLLISAATNENISPFGVGFGVTSNQVISNDAVPSDSNHPFYTESVYNPVLNPVYQGGSVAHNVLIGVELVSIMEGSAGQGVVLAEKVFGSGLVLFSGLTTPFFVDAWTPQPLMANVLYRMVSYGVSSNKNPTITAIPNQSTCPGSSVSNIEFTIDDAETPADGLTLSATSSNSGLLPVSNIVFGGSGASRTISLMPVAGQSGTSNVKVEVSDALGGKVSTGFTLTVQDITAPAPTVLSGSVTLTPTPGSTSGWSPYVWSFIDPIPTGATVIGIDIDYTAVDQGWGGTGANSNLYVSGQYIGSGQLFHTANSFNLSYSGPVGAYTYGGSNSLEMYFSGYPGWRADWLSGTIKIRYGLPVVSSECSVTSLVAPTATDNCAGVVTVTNDAVFPITVQGTTVVTWTYDDGNGNTSTQTQNVIINDVTLPTVKGQNITVALDEYGEVSIDVSMIENGSTDNCGISVIELDKTSFTCANVGANTVTLKVTDTNGNVATQTAIVTVEDKVAPVVLTNGDKNVNTDFDICGAVVVVSASATDNCTVGTPMGVRSDDLALDAVYPVGTTTIAWNVVDANSNDAVEVTQTIIVTDSQNPIAITKNITVQLNASGNATIVAADVNNGSTDNCGIATLILDKTSFTCSNVGVNTVTLKVTDTNGNVTTKTAIVTVEDKMAPVVVTKNKTIQLNAAGTASIVLADINNGSTDNCGITTLTLDKTNFTCANVGANTVTLKVTDINGNVASQTAIVTVEDKIAPVVLTKNITVQLDASSNIAIAAADVNNGSTDNCGIRLLELDRATFSCANVGDNTVTLKVTDNSGNVSTKTAIVTVVNTQPNLIRKHFDDVIFFDNSSASFKSYTWYKNGLLVSGQTAQYFKDSGVLNGVYYAMATKVDGTVVTTCPLTFSASVEVEYLKIAPNPVRSNSVYQLITNVDSARLQNAHVTIFNILGTLIMDSVIDKNVIELVAPSVEGIYIVKMTLANGKYFTKNLLVKN
jgi:hypothetical protein